MSPYKSPVPDLRCGTAALAYRNDFRPPHCSLIPVKVENMRWTRKQTEEAALAARLKKALVDEIPPETVERHLKMIEDTITTTIMEEEGTRLPTPGRVVWYQTDGRKYDYYLPAMVVVTKANLIEEAVEAQEIAGLDSDLHVHLWVPGGIESYREFNVPYDPRGGRRTWRWPERN